jgi:poly(A) polymerase
MRINETWLNAPETQKVMQALGARGAQAFFVGGCVRNAVIGAAVSDIDIATNATPEQVVALAKEADLRAVPTGMDHGTVTLVSAGAAYEVTTFRKDVATDGRRATVAYASLVEDDARRRDFTMNALYADANGQVLDPLGGLDDLLARHVRFIGDASKRIAEDYLRVLRFFRFHAWYGDAVRGLDADGLAACEAAIGGLGRLSKERVGAEMRKLLSAQDPVQSVEAMGRSGILRTVLSDADHSSIREVIELECRLELDVDWRRRLAALSPADAVRDLRLSRKDARRLDQIARFIGQSDDLSAVAYYTDAEVAMDVAILRAVRTGTPLYADVVFRIEKGAEAVFPIVAADLIEKYSGKELGKTLKDLENKWILSGFELTKESLLHGL